MNKGTKTATKNETKKERQTIKVNDFSVMRAKVFENGGVVIDITINGIAIYGVNIVEGKNGDFLSFPQRKGKDGKYYSIVYAALSDSDQADIIKEAENYLANN